MPHNRHPVDDTQLTSVFLHTPPLIIIRGMLRSLFLKYCFKNSTAINTNFPIKKMTSDAKIVSETSTNTTMRLSFVLFDKKVKRLCILTPRWQ